MNHRLPYFVSQQTTKIDAQHVLQHFVPTARATFRSSQKQGLRIKKNVEVCSANCPPGQNIWGANTGCGLFTTSCDVKFDASRSWHSRRLFQKLPQNAPQRDILLLAPTTMVFLSATPSTTSPHGVCRQERGCLALRGQIRTGSHEVEDGATAIDRASAAAATPGQTQGCKQGCPATAMHLAVRTLFLAARAPFFQSDLGSIPPRGGLAAVHVAVRLYFPGTAEKERERERRGPRRGRGRGRQVCTGAEPAAEYRRWLQHPRWQGGGMWQQLRRPGLQNWAVGADPARASFPPQRVRNTRRLTGGGQGAGAGQPPDVAALQQLLQRVSPAVLAAPTVTEGRNVAAAAVGGATEQGGGSGSSQGVTPAAVGAEHTASEGGWGQGAGGSATCGCRRAATLVKCV